MSRKISANDIFTGTAFTGPGYVLIADDRGVVEAIVTSAEAGEGVEKFDGMLCPGFINAHCHIELSHLKNKIPQHTGLVDFVQKVMTERRATAGEKEAAMRTAEEELYNSGTVAVGDICNTIDSVSLKKASKIYWHNFIEISGFVDAGAQKRFDDAAQISELFKNQIPASDKHRLRQAQPDSQRVSRPSTFNIQHSTLSPHSPYSVSKKLFNLINEATANQLITIHNQESAAENELYKSKSGKFLSLYENFGIDISSFEPTGNDSFQTWLNYFTNAQKIISVHNTFTNPEDLQYSTFNTQHSTLSYCLCPNANLYIENTMPPVKMLMDNNCHIVLGTDSYASNEQLNIFEEIKTLRKKFPEIPLAIMLQWATLNGAITLGIDNKYGSFEKGKQPGIVLIKENVSKRI